MEAAEAVRVNRVFHDHECAYYDERFAIVHDARSARQARAEVERLFYLVRSRGGKIASDRGADHLHGIRVAIKHWRYAGEIARAVMPRVLYRPMSVKLRHLQDLGGESQDFADLASVVEKELADDGTREERNILAAVRAERARAAREFYDALKALLPSSRAANGG